MTITDKECRHEEMKVEFTSISHGIVTECRICQKCNKSCTIYYQLINNNVEFNKGMQYV